MNRKILALNLGLLALLGTLGWMLRAHWREARAQRAGHAGESRPSERAASAAFARAARSRRAGQLSGRRAEDAVLERPQSERDYRGRAASAASKPKSRRRRARSTSARWGSASRLRFLSIEKGGQKGFHVGDDVGPFKLVAFNRETITFEWNGKTLEYPLAELKPKEPARRAAGQPPRPAVTPAKVAVSRPGDRTLPTTKTPVLGTQNGEIRSCVPGDKSPAGTVKDGFKKTRCARPVRSRCVSGSPLNDQCSAEQKPMDFDLGSGRFGRRPSACAASPCAAAARAATACSAQPPAQTAATGSRRRRRRRDPS